MIDRAPAGTEVLAGDRVLAVVVAAEESAGLQLLRALAATPHRIVAVMTGTGGPRPSGVAALARRLGLEVRDAARVRDAAFADELAAARVDLVLNAHSLHVFHAAALAAPAIGAFNLHPGPLPRYAGLNAPSWAIYRGEARHGVTVHRMAPRIDAGTIAYQAGFDVAPDETGLSLMAKCVRAGVPLLLGLVATAARDPGAIPAHPQELGRREYFGREVPQQGAIAWARPAREVVAFVRAADYHPFVSPWGHPRAALGVRSIGIVKAATTGVGAGAPPGTVRRCSASVEVAAADEWVAVTLLQVEGRYAAPGDVLADGDRLDDGR